MSWSRQGGRSGPRGYHHGNLKEALIRAALELIAQKGPAGFTFAEAARWAGVSPAAPYRHFRDRDELLADDCVFRAIPNSIQGVEQWKMYAAAFLTAFPDDLQVIIGDSFAIGDKVAVRWTAQGTHNGPLRGIAPTGKGV